MSRIAIIGPGNVGLAMAAYLAKINKEPVLYAIEGHARNISKINAQKNVLKTAGVFKLTFEVETVDNIVDLVATTSAIIVATPASGHAAVIDELLKVKDKIKDHVIIAICGCLFAQRAKVAGLEALFIGETSTSPYASRLPEMNVLLKGVKVFIPIGGLNDPHQEIKDRVEELFPLQLRWQTNYLKLFFWNVALIVHVYPSVMNAGWIESPEEFRFYKDGMSDGVCRVQEELDAVRVKLAKICGFEVPSLLEIMNGYYDTAFATWRDFAYNSIPHNMLKEASKTLNHRYILQDIPCLMVPFYQLARKAGLPEKETDIAKAAVVIGSSMMGTDFMNTGLNMQALGWEDLSLEEIKNSR